MSQNPFMVSTLRAHCGLNTAWRNGLSGVCGIPARKRARSFQKGLK